MGAKTWMLVYPWACSHAILACVLLHPENARENGARTVAFEPLNWKACPTLLYLIRNRIRPAKGMPH